MITDETVEGILSSIQALVNKAYARGVTDERARMLEILKTPPTPPIEAPKQTVIAPAPSAPTTIITQPKPADVVQKVVEKPKPAPPKIAPQPPQPKAIRPVQKGPTKVNIIEYLRKRGDEIQPLGIGGKDFMVNGCRLSMAEVLSRINYFRRQADLPELGPEHIE